MLTKNGRRNRPATHIHLVPNSESPASDSLDFFSTKLRNDDAPFADGSRADAQRPGDIRRLLKVIDNFAFEHGPSLSELKGRLQVRSQPSVLTSVDMDKLNDLADRLTDAMSVAGVNASQLARECRVSPAAVTHWLNRQTQKLTAANYAAAGRALGVNEEWLRTGKLPRERDAQAVQLERLQAALSDLRGPLTALLAAVNELSPPAQETSKKKRAR